MSRVAVCAGGFSLEREVSLQSGRRVAAALVEIGHEAELLDPGPSFIDDLWRGGFEVCFLALHGRGGEDGDLPELLETAGVPYTGSDPLACGRSFDKTRARFALKKEGLPVPRGHSFSKNAFLRMGARRLLDRIAGDLGLPLVVKPGRQGSGLGIRVVEDEADLADAVLHVLAYDDRIVFETYVSGAEYAIGMLGTGDDVHAFPIVEVHPERAFYDYDAHYREGETNLTIPAPLPESGAAQLREIAARAYRTLGCRDFGRVDLVVGPDGPAVLEVSAVPGLTDTSTFPLAAAADGLSFGALCGRILDAALRRGPVPEAS